MDVRRYLEKRKATPISVRYRHFINGMLILLAGTGAFEMIVGILLTVNKRTPHAVITISFGVLLIVFTLFFWFIWKRKVSDFEKQLIREELRFSNSSEYVDVFNSEYCWSESSKGVIDKFSSIADRKLLMELGIQTSKYLALQNQINPHFLYNALDAIRGDLLIAHEEEIASAVESLSKYFSYVITNVERLATISEEVGNVKDYFKVQQYRFGDRVNLEFVDELEQGDIEQLLIPRVTLQPIVENAISHGLERASRKGTVSVHIKDYDGLLVIQVKDDGVGMNNETLAKLNNELRYPRIEEPQGTRKRGGIALKNVNSRIKMLFGDDYGLQVFSMENAGTDVVVRLPQKTKHDMDAANS